MVSRGRRLFLPYAFTEHGAFMAAGLLNSPRAVEVSVFVVRAFVKLRQLALTHKDLAGKLDQLERKVSGRDDAIRQLVAAIRQLNEGFEFDRYLDLASISSIRGFAQVPISTSKFAGSQSAFFLFPFSLRHLTDGIGQEETQRIANLRI